MAEDYKKGALHKMLGIPLDKKIPFTWLEAIKKTEIGEYADNPTKIGKPTVKVTKLLKQRAVRALNWKRIGQKAKENADALNYERYDFLSLKREPITRNELKDRLASGYLNVNQIVKEIDNGMELKTPFASYRKL